MKSVLFSLVFAFSAVAFADQQQTVVEFNTYFSVFTCTKLQQSQDYSCTSSSAATEKASVKLEKVADQEGMMVGTLSLDKDADGYKHMAQVKVMQHTPAQQATHYGFHVQEAFFPSAQQMPNELDHTYGAVHTSAPANLNEVTFYGRIVRTETQILIPILAIGPATVEPQPRLMNINPKLF